MKLIQLSFKELDNYHTEIPMIKSGSNSVVITNANKVTLLPIKPFSIDMTTDESTSLWKNILNEEKTQILCFVDNGKLIAGSITVTHSPKVNMLKGDMKNSVLWDIRVHPDYQRLGIASKLFEESVIFSKNQHCTNMLIETQNNNPKAINFYIKHKAVLLEENKDVYQKELNETQLIFIKKI